ncbi:MAG: hypothetical protein HQK96_06920 [Nitrospirae bacterium]|nr:hypothetical protein [Nitrospirota bacterium]
MRSIGVKNVRMVKETTRRIMKDNPGYSDITGLVRDELPVSLWEIWESADSEINRIITDTIFGEVDKRKI